MKKFYILFILLCFTTAKSYGFNHLKINGSRSATIALNDSFTVSGNFSSSDTAAGILYYDVNSNNTLDAGDKWVGKFRLIDGG